MHKSRGPALTMRAFLNQYTACLKAELVANWLKLSQSVFVLLGILISSIVAVISKKFSCVSVCDLVSVLRDPLVGYAISTSSMIRVVYPREYGMITTDVLRNTLDRYYIFPCNPITIVMIESLAAASFWGAFVIVVDVTLAGVGNIERQLINSLASIPLLLIGALIAMTFSLCIECLLVRRRDIWSVGLIFRVLLITLSGSWYPLFGNISGPLSFAAYLNPFSWSAYMPARVLIGVWDVKTITFSILMGLVYAGAGLTIASHLFRAQFKYS